MITLAYATVGSNDLVAAKNFYDALLGLAGVPPLFEHPSGGRVYGREGQLFFGVLGPYDGKPATIGNGSMMAFGFGTRAEVDAFYAKALELGGTDEGAPSEKSAHYYFRISGILTGTSFVPSAWRNYQLLSLRASRTASRSFLQKRTKKLLFIRR